MVVSVIPGVFLCFSGGLALRSHKPRCLRIFFIILNLNRDDLFALHLKINKFIDKNII